MIHVTQILIKNHVFFLFIILEFVSFQILISNSFVVESKLSKSIIEFSAFFFLKKKQMTDYLFLKSTNQKLLIENSLLTKENLFLKTQLELIEHNDTSNYLPDSTIVSEAKIVKKTWKKKQNFIIINRGEKHGVMPNMGVIHHNCLVGVTKNVSKNFSTIISIINTELMISAKIKKSGTYGTLMWDGNNVKTIQLHDIPKHAKLNIGDTIVTSGYSNIFPENIKIGQISDYQIEKNTNFLNISVTLFTDFTNIEFVYIMKRLLQSERELIEKTL